jgi:hypothetical protein
VRLSLYQQNRTVETSSISCIVIGRDLENPREVEDRSSVYFYYEEWLAFVVHYYRNLTIYKVTHTTYKLNSTQ